MKLLTGHQCWQSPHKVNGRLRRCIHPKKLNSALKRVYHPVPTVKELFADIASAKVFSKCDIRYGFWHVQIVGC